MDFAGSCYDTEQLPIYYNKKCEKSFYPQQRLLREEALSLTRKNAKNRHSSHRLFVPAESGHD